MPTILRDGPLRVVLYTDDHPPPHEHIFGDGETKVVLAVPEAVRIVGVGLSESRRALGIMRENRDYLMQRWNDIHG